MAKIPALYRIWFSRIDPILTITGILGNTFAQEAILESYTPNYTSPPAPETIVLLYTLSGFFCCLLCLQVWLLLLARSTDLTVWRAIQAGTVMVDLAILAAIARTLDVEGRVHSSAWRSGEWTNILVTGWVTLLRLAFLAGVGMGSERDGAKATKVS